MTGQRKDQSLTRAMVPIVQVDPAFQGKDGGPGSLVKFNPLSSISSNDLWTVIRLSGVPTNSLHEKGFVSIGCEPCTRPVVPGQHEREGRWWWEDETLKECGLHKGNLDEEVLPILHIFFLSKVWVWLLFGFCCCYCCCCDGSSSCCERAPTRPWLVNSSTD